MINPASDQGGREGGREGRQKESVVTVRDINTFSILTVITVLRRFKGKYF